MQVPERDIHEPAILIKTAFQHETVEDGLLIQELMTRVASDRLGKLEQLAIMDTIFRKNVVITKKEIDRKVFIQTEEIQRPKQTIFDPKDLSLKLGKKASKGWVGSKCQVVETAQKGKVNFITNMIYQQAKVHDCNVHGKLREGNECRGLEPEKVYADMSYINGGAICEHRKHGQELTGYIRGQHAKIPEEFKAYNFSIDMQKLQAICPAGQLTSHTLLQKDGYVGFQFRKSTKALDFMAYGTPDTMVSSAIRCNSINGCSDQCETANTGYDQRCRHTDINCPGLQNIETIARDDFVRDRKKANKKKSDGHQLRNHLVYAQSVPSRTPFIQCNHDVIHI